MRRAVSATLFFTGLIAIWHLAAASGRWSPVLLPSPLAVFEYLSGAIADGSLLEATAVTLKRLLVGYAIGLLIGLPLRWVPSRSACRPCRVFAGCRWHSSGSDRPKVPCCSSSSWAPCSRS
jgi:ABC-type nitrate/sulfonate/bicarbonate transport system permease component